MTRTVRRRDRGGVPKRSCWVFFQVTSTSKTLSGRGSFTSNLQVFPPSLGCRRINNIGFGMSAHTRVPRTVREMTTLATEVLKGHMYRGRPRMRRGNLGHSEETLDYGSEWPSLEAVEPPEPELWRDGEGVVVFWSPGNKSLGGKWNRHDYAICADFTRYDEVEADELRTGLLRRYSIQE